MSGDFGEDLFTTIAELAMEYAKRRLLGEQPKLKLYVGFEDGTAGDTDTEVHRLPDKRAGADDRPRKAAPPPGVRRKALR